MTAQRSPARSTDAARWRALREDTRLCGTLVACVEACLPAFRDCAQLVCGDIAAGDRLTEQFLIELLAAGPASNGPMTTEILTARFEHFLIRKFHDASRSKPDPGDDPAILSAEDFLKAIASR